MVYIISILIWFLTIIQGGFFVNSYGIAAGILAVSLIFTCIKNPKEFAKQIKAQANPIVTIGFFVILVSFVISGVINAHEQEFFSRFIYFLFVWLFYIGTGFVKKNERKMVYQQIRYLLYVQAVFCVLDYLGIVVFSTMQNARFMGTMQYANAAAIFMAVGIMFQRAFEHGEEKEWKYVKLFSLVVLCTTFSAGGMLCYITGCLIYGMLGEKENRGKKIFFSLVEFGVSFLFALGWYVSVFRLKHTAVTVIMILFTMVCSCFWNKTEAIYETGREGIKEHLTKTSEPKKIRKGSRWTGDVCGIVVLLAVVGGFLYFFGSRVSGTGLERLEQMKDAILVLVRHPIAGIGVDGWEQYIACREDILYHAAYVHCSYLHLGVELGILAILGLILILIGGFWQTKRNKTVYPMGMTACAMLCLHFLVDFTGFFAGVLVLCMIAETSENEKVVYNK